MKQIFLLVLFLFVVRIGEAQTIVTHTFQPDSAGGKDTYIESGTNAGLNFGSYFNFAAIRWTISSVPFTSRGLLAFNLDSIPANAIITSAKLSLYCNTTSDQPQLHSGLNASYIEKVTSSWDEFTTTWSNQPPTTTIGRITLAQSSSSTQDYPDIDVTSLVQGMVESPTTNYGLMLKLATESTYRSIQFASSDHSDASKRPKLEVSYYIPREIKIINPNGGERFTKNAINTIRWTSSNATPNVQLQYSINDGVSWNTIVTSVADIGSYNWLTPNLISTQCRIRIASVEDSTIVDTSNATFSIGVNPIVNVVFQPDSAIGKDTYIESGTKTGSNFGSYFNFAAISWTISSVPFTSRGLLAFDLDSIPANAVVTNAKLSLYCNTTSDQTQLHSGLNASYLEKVTSSWDEYGATWTNQPTTTTTGRITLAQSTSSTQNYSDIDVTSLVQGMVESPTTNYGFMLKLATESTYRSLQFASSDHSNASKRPKLEVSYYIPREIKIINPNGGEWFTRNTINTIRWTSSDATPNVQLQYSIDNGLSWNTIVTSVPDTGSYNWLTPNLISSQCRIRIASVEDSILADTSNETFSIGVNPIVNVVFQPDSALGKDTYIENGTNVGLNFGSYFNFAAIRWTISSVPFTSRGLLEFNLTSIPNDAVVTSAKLSLYCNTTSDQPQLHSGLNESYLEKVTSSWTEYGATWSNQPTTTTTGRITLAQSSSSTQDYPDIDVTSLVQGMVESPTTNYGFMLKLGTESTYRSLQFASSDHGNSTKRPKIEISYYRKPSITLTSLTGGETVLKQHERRISWVSVNATPNVTLQYSINNGISWNTLDSMIVDTGAYDWFVPDSVSSQCLVRVISYENASLGDTSNAVFSIVNPPTYRITSPNGGEVWYNDEIKSIQWTGTGLNNVRIQYSLNDTIWTDITSNNNSLTPSFAWYPDGIVSDHVRIRIIDYMYPVYGDTSDAVFSIHAKPSFVFTRPVNDSIWFCGDSNTIEWTGSGSRLATLEYSVTEGVWVILEDSIAASTTSFVFIPSGFNKQQIKFRLSDIDFPDVYTESNSVNVFEKPSIDLQSPIGGEWMFTGEIHNITWSSSFSDSVNIFYSVDGISWIAIDSNINSSSGTLAWTVPSLISNTFQIKIADTRFTQYFDTTATVFFVRNAPQFSFTSPTQSEVWFVGENKTITWTSTNSRYGRLEYAVNNGTWVIVEDSILPSTLATTWIPAGLHKANIQFRISDIDLPGVYTIGPIVKVYQKPILQITSPNGGERIIRGSVDTISWTALYSDSVHVYYSTNGITWVPFAMNVNATAGSLVWNVPSAATASARLRIVDARFGSYFDTTDLTFSIINPPVLTLVSPNGGEEWLNNSTQVITWTSSDVNNLSIAYSVNNMDWNTIATGIPAATGSYNWTLPAINSTTVKVRLTDEEFANNIDTGNGWFSILTPPTLNLITPNGGELWYVDSTYTLSWSSININNVDLSYSVNDSAWISIATNVSSHSYDWQIPTTLVSDKLKVKVQSVGSFSVSDVSDNNFETRVYLHSAVKETNLSAALISLYPNPSTGTFTISMPPSNDVYSLRVVDMSGRVLFERSGITENVHNIDLGLIDVGIYFVELTNDMGVKAVKRIQIRK